jgi:hypothetical protein
MAEVVWTRDGRTWVAGDWRITPSGTVSTSVEMWRIWYKGQPMGFGALAHLQARVQRFANRPWRRPSGTQREPALRRRDRH